MSGSYCVGKEPHPLHRLSLQLTALSKENASFTDFLRMMLEDFVEPYGTLKVVLWLGQDGRYLRVALDRDRDDDGFEAGLVDDCHFLKAFETRVERGERDEKLEYLLCPADELDRGFFVLDGSKSGPKRGEVESLDVLLVPIGSKDERLGMVELEFEGRCVLEDDEIRALVDAAQALGPAVSSFRSQSELRERVKELTCLYGIAKLAARPGVSLDMLLQGIVELLPPAWQYPDITGARIAVDERCYTSRQLVDAVHRQVADIVVRGEYRGCVEVSYMRPVSAFDASPFLEWEGRLIKAIARQVALIIERRQNEEERSKLQEQLRHADRLATIGQLTAGVAHELNEPLANILGFAQLALQDGSISPQVAADLARIEGASLHAREVIRKLMFFSRQMPQKTVPVELNQLVEDGLFFLASRCAKAGVDLVREFAADLPDISVDPSQMNQVLVNVVVNAVQAMPEGGTLTVGTGLEKDFVLLTVEDTGLGMTEDVKRRIFLPFFTTKDVDRGTGLGLAVVHGIVTSLGGTIDVDTRVGEGTRFTIKIPVDRHRQSGGDEATVE